LKFCYIVYVSTDASPFFLLLVQIKPNDAIKDRYEKQMERFFDSLRVRTIDSKKIGMLDFVH